MKHLGVPVASYQKMFLFFISWVWLITGPGPLETWMAWTVQYSVYWTGLYCMYSVQYTSGLSTVLYTVDLIYIQQLANTKLSNYRLKYLIVRNGGGGGRGEGWRRCLLKWMAPTPCPLPPPGEQGHGPIGHWRPPPLFSKLLLIESSHFLRLRLHTCTAFLSHTAPGWVCVCVCVCGSSK